MARQSRRRREATAPLLDALEIRALLNADLLVRFVDGLPTAASSALLRDVQGTVVSRLPDGSERVALGTGIDPDAAVAELGGSRSIVYAERADRTYRIAATVPNDPQFSGQWGLNNPRGNGVDIGAPAAWDVTTGTHSTVVAVIDTGIDLHNSEFAGQLWDGPGGVHGWNFLNNSADIQDNNGHGTHVAGILGAVGNNGNGVAGVDWGISMMVLRAIDASGNGSIEAIVGAIDYAVQNGARVINASWDGAVNDPALANAVAYAGAHNVVFVAAAGNQSANDDVVPCYPASYRAPNEIGVAAVDQYGNLARFSNYGTGTVAIAAPGVDILSTYLDNGSNGGVATLTGTSMAAPFVSGVVALVAGLHPDYSASQLVNAVLSTAKPLPSLAGWVRTGGIVDAAAAVRYGTVASPSQPTTPPPSGTTSPPAQPTPTPKTPTPPSPPRTPAKPSPTSHPAHPSHPLRPLPTHSPSHHVIPPRITPVRQPKVRVAGPSRSVTSL